VTDEQLAPVLCKLLDLGWAELDEHELQLLALKYLMMGCEELGIDIGEFLDFIEDTYG
jgi:hypothetical protein